MLPFTRNITQYLPDAVVLEVGERFSDNLQRRMEILLDWASQLA